MTYENILTIYKHCGHFTFIPTEELKYKCNAPKDNGGIYLIYRLDDQHKTLLYIGSSGRRGSKGELKIRKGGLYARLVNGYHPNRFGQDRRIKRSKAIPEHMIKSGTDKIEVKWWITYDEDHSDFPTDIESKIRELYLNSNDVMPPWHKIKQ